MPISYLLDHSWDAWSREERLYCAELFWEARGDPGGLANWIAESCSLKMFERGGEWNLGFEVRFYRDFLWHHGRSARREQYSPKRTFDLCLFSERSIVVVEAKVFQGFETGQLESFRNDMNDLKKLTGNPKMQVFLVALASSKYLKSMRSSTRDYFCGWFSWSQLETRYKNEAFKRADELYNPSHSKVTGHAV